MLKLHAASAALVLIDLQEGILPFAKGPHTAAQVVLRAARLADAFRAVQAPVVLVRVVWASDFADAPKQPVDSASNGALPENWWAWPPTLDHQQSDILVTKRQWGAFYGTDLELQLRRRGVDTLVLGGISTNIGVESTARNAWELGFNLVIVEDICSAAEHPGSFNSIFPRLGRVRSSEQVIAAL
ncbi:hydrolase [Erwinia tracheiphila]|uniref:Hydrolase n=1 Tax=Erwinia tracheiphila TaxID=65700 RepID=A0A0M2KFR4_9GAMM|nr:hydrolase [Erwinia tracheiphila]EOS93237.1 hydrolase [Erwinia tracheiphila PSU-1]KKF35786.1 hydrolase [Erwinia tracheiphila]UIA89968.1 hydrolase [Erwinia tracheiphila]UIA98272.1 hydrolase [Erwinia tracheiphila]